MTHNNQYTPKEDLVFKTFRSGEYKVYRPNPEAYPDWYEYIVEMEEGLDNYNGHFDSLNETYNGCVLQQLNRRDAIRCAQDLIMEREEMGDDEF